MALRLYLCIFMWPTNEEVRRGISEGYRFSGRAPIPCPDLDVYAKYTFTRKCDDGFTMSTNGRPIAPRGR